MKQSDNPTWAKVCICLHPTASPVFASRCICGGEIKVPDKAHAPKSEAQQRKETPIFSGVIRYFPRAIAAVANCSFVGNEQHNPGTPLHWDRSKSSDELDALARHLKDAGTIDTDGVRHSTKVAWRALANLEKELEAAELQHAQSADGIAARHGASK